MRNKTQFLLAVVLILTTGLPAIAKKYTLDIGYLPSIKGESISDQGLSGGRKLSMALESINNRTDLLPDVRLQLEWGDTRCDTVVATGLLTNMSCSGVVAFFGPEGRCQTEAIVAQSRNLDSYAKPVISLLRYYRWFKFSIIYEEPWMTLANALANYAKKNNMSVNHQRSIVNSLKCCEEKMSCCETSFMYSFIQETMHRTRIYVYLGTRSGLVEMMSAMESLHLFTKGEFMVIFVDIMTFSPKESYKYLIKMEDRVSELECPNTEEFRKRGQSLLVVVPSESNSKYEYFSNSYNEYNNKKSFKLALPDAGVIEFNKNACIYAISQDYVVNLYATALQNLIEEETIKKNKTLTREKLMNIATNGSRIMLEMTKIIPFSRVSGMSFLLDERADLEGNFSLLAFKPSYFSDDDINCTYSMIPVGHFQQSTKEFPIYTINPRVPIDWADNVKPDDEPSYSFLTRNFQCRITQSWLMILWPVALLYKYFGYFNM